MENLTEKVKKEDKKSCAVVGLGAMKLIAGSMTRILPISIDVLDKRVVTFNLEIAGILSDLKLQLDLSMSNTKRKNLKDTMNIALRIAKYDTKTKIYDI